MTAPTTIRALSVETLDIPLHTPFGIAGETQDLARNAIETARGTVEGADAREWRLLAGKLHDAIGPVGSAQCAIETAILDALTRHGQMPLWAFFGGASTSLETDMTITTTT